jgi:branched-chain amino acid transport system permease protein
MATQRFLITPCSERERHHADPASLLLITLGLGYAISNLFMMIYGSDYKTIPTAASKAYLTVEVGDFLFTTQWARVIAFLAAFLIGFALWFIINKTELGKKIRAVSQNRDAAAICGVDVYKTYSVAFGLGIAAVAVAGLAFRSITSFSRRSEPCLEQNRSSSWFSAAWAAFPARFSAA